ncbi:hypothetical protein BO94DRAFT_45083 [Aspergillus sclerotioniger CBS 115572]|uniref:Uncharacterized protein n=1 Tax=Aspergillus sclerotioniger CBS 115572 TaxID=1450535 RepID=A0A317WRF8_9EURO|nr:hypothetical protein BO94DRAFT_45083 [Aspergillus sclerotioniger CBS 115572]PWY88595.1 hypothetical protein BO94DRAFT_45083 [Aspergillus sclerotioniger CBS 115572]
MEKERKPTHLSNAYYQSLRSLCSEYHHPLVAQEKVPNASICFFSLFFFFPLETMEYFLLPCITSFQAKLPLRNSIVCRLLKVLNANPSTSAGWHEANLRPRSKNPWSTTSNHLHQTDKDFSIGNSIYQTGHGCKRPFSKNNVGGSDESFFHENSNLVLFGIFYRKPMTIWS